MKTNLLFLILFASSTCFAQKLLDSFEGLEFAIKEQMVLTEIGLLKYTYGFEAGVDRYPHENYPYLREISIKNQTNSFLNTKMFFIVDNIDGVSILAGGLDIYKYSSSSQVCTKFNQLKNQLENNYEWIEIEGFHRGECCSCQKSIDTYYPKSHEYDDSYVAYYTKTFRGELGYAIISAFESYKGSWFVRVAYFTPGFLPVYNKFYNIN